LCVEHANVEDSHTKHSFLASGLDDYASCVLLAAKSKLATRKKHVLHVVVTLRSICFFNHSSSALKLDKWCINCSEIVNIFH